MFIVYNNNNMSNYLESNNKESKLISDNSIPLPLVPKIPDSEPTQDLAQPTMKDKETIIIDPAQYYVKASFMITYILSLTTATVTFTESLRTSVAQNRHMLNLLTCTSIVSGYFYSLYLNKINRSESDNTPIDWADILKTRYIDWAITSPVLLIILCSVLATIANKKLMFSTMSSVLMLNYVMLMFGFVGETNNLNKYVSVIFGGSAFYTMFYVIYKNFLDVTKMDSIAVYSFYFIIWGLYGIMYMLDNTYKNIGFNILDFLSKTLFGLGLWLYYSKLVTV